jgi:hypothetical protein
MRCGPRRDGRCHAAHEQAGPGGYLTTGAERRPSNLLVIVDQSRSFFASAASPLHRAHAIERRYGGLRHPVAAGKPIRPSFRSMSC